MSCPTVTGPWSMVTGANALPSKQSFYRNFLTILCQALEAQTGTPSMSNCATSGIWNVITNSDRMISDQEFYSQALTTLCALKDAIVAGGGGAGGDITVNNVTFNSALNDQTELAYAATTDIDFDAGSARYTSLGGDVTFTTSNRAAGKMVKIKILADGSERTFTFPSWTWLETAPTTIAAGKTGMLVLECWGANDENITASYAVEP